MNATGLSHVAHPADGFDRRDAATGTGLWMFIVVASSLFSLFLAAYVMRMDGSDWSAIGMPWQLWLSTVLLSAGSLTLQQAAVSARHMQRVESRRLFYAGGACALAFLAVQLWAWHVLLGMRVVPVGNPAGSFFYMLTALHGLHVLGGLAGWGMTVRLVWDGGTPGDSAHVARRITLCARYWHFLLLVWVVLFATFAGVTPAVIRFICGAP